MEHSSGSDFMSQNWAGRALGAMLEGEGAVTMHAFCQRWSECWPVAAGLEALLTDGVCYTSDSYWGMFD